MSKAKPMDNAARRYGYAARGPELTPAQRKREDKKTAAKLANKGKGK